MIRYALKCTQGHQFESWFQSAEAFDKLHASGMVECAMCGDTAVTKSLMAPNIGAKSNTQPDTVSENPLSTPANPAEKAIADLKKHVEENSDYVGDSFATEARAMHDGEAPERAIHGEAKLDDAKKLIEDGVPIAPLPFAPNRKTN
ncbi:hypothetical protein ATO10_14764 [Actibacterium atlanticum]|uniref:DUF1178 family protein n=1 Tax=Actibacterium atlanticum TaxID=1461693 RepID=A0A058ZI96_9RHOB|nr:DUF1178 family protein [Actibacterium atlanticum]KCV80922.1 hypothetical protein ATO10_14764 [Actibacterium atlanticum]